jgi:hypothetical protein
MMIATRTLMRQLPISDIAALIRATLAAKKTQHRLELFGRVRFEMNAITRNLKIVFGDVASDVPVRIFWPLEDKGGWGCRWEIDWPDRQRSNFGRGTDAIQALLHALQMVGAEIYCSEEHRSGQLSWRDDWSGYGFLVPGNLRGLLRTDDKKYL